MTIIDYWDKRYVRMKCLGSDEMLTAENCVTAGLAGMS